MSELIPEETVRFVRALAPAVDDTVEAMEAYGETHGPTSIGREVGQLFRLLTEMSGAERVFEFGSGYGYSAYWFALGLPDDGEVVLTDTDADNLDRARDFFERGGQIGKARFEVGDAHEVAAAEDGPFDVVLVDHDKSRYAEALAEVREKVAPGGLLVADNAMISTSLQFDKLLDLVEGGDPDGVNDSTRGVAEYLTRVRDDDAFETVVVPLGEGVAVSRRVD